MGQALTRPCPSCAEMLDLPAPLVTCPTCDRDFSVARAEAGPDPYRDAPRVTLAPARRPPPAGCRIRDDGNHIVIGAGTARRHVSPVTRGVGAAVVVGPLLLLRIERAPGQHVGVLARLFGVWGLLCLLVWGVAALARRLRREELWLEEGVIGWRGGGLAERMAFLQDIAWIEVREDGPTAWVEIGFRSSETWAVGRAQGQDPRAMAWLGRRLLHATRPL